MYAVIESGGKQYRVELGSEIAVDRLDAQTGGSFDSVPVLLVADGDAAAIGRPTVEGARVTLDVMRQERGEKLVVFKYRPKARRRVKHGHRQELTILRVADIALGDRSARSEAEAARAERERLEAARAKEASKRAAADKALADKLAREADSESGTDTASRGRLPRRGGRAKATKAETSTLEAKSSEAETATKPEIAAEPPTATEPAAASDSAPDLARETVVRGAAPEGETSDQQQTGKDE